MQSVSSRIWTHVAVSISYDDNHYTTGTWFGFMAYQPLLVILYQILFLHNIEYMLCKHIL